MTSGRKLEGGQLYLLSVFDLEPSGVIVHAYNQITSKEYMLPVLEKELAAANLTRSKAHLSSLLESVKMVPAGGEYVLQSDYEAISKIKRRPTGEEVEALIKAPMAPGMSLLRCHVCIYVYIYLCVCVLLSLIFTNPLPTSTLQQARSPSTPSWLLAV